MFQWGFCQTRARKLLDISHLYWLYLDAKQKSSDYFIIQSTQTHYIPLVFINIHFHNFYLKTIFIHSAAKWILTLDDPEKDCFNSKTQKGLLLFKITWNLDFCEIIFSRFKFRNSIRSSHWNSFSSELKCILVREFSILSISA